MAYTGSDLRQHILGRFGNSAVARQAAQQALEAARTGTADMFESRPIAASGLHGMRDSLSEAADAILQPDAGVGRRNQMQDQYPYRQPVHTEQQSVQPPQGLGSVFLTEPSSTTPTNAGPLAHHSAAGPNSPDTQHQDLTRAAHNMQGNSKPRSLSAHLTGRPASPGPSRRTQVKTSHRPSPGSPATQRTRGVSGHSPAARSALASQRAGRVASAPSQRGSSSTSTSRVNSAHSPQHPSRSVPPSQAANGQQQQQPSLHSPAGHASNTTSPHTSPVRTSRPLSPATVGRAGWTPQGYLSHVDVSLADREARRQELHEHGEEFFNRYRIKQHLNGSPDYTFSQPRSEGPMVTISQNNISFDEAHPALADQHYLRSSQQQALLAEEQARIRQLKARRRSVSPRSSPPVSVEKLHHEIQALQASREAGKQQLHLLEQEGQDIRAVSRDIRQRAEEAIAASQGISAMHRSRSPTPTRAPGHTPPRRAWASSTKTSSRPGSPAAMEGYGRVLEDDALRMPQQMQHAYDVTGSPQAQSMHASSHSQKYQQYQQPPVGQGWPHLVTDQEAAWQQVDRVPAELQNTGQVTADASDRDVGAPPLAHKQTGPALSQQEFQMASGAYSPQKFEEYNRQMDLEMQERAKQQAYESDNEREEEASRAAAFEAVTDEQRAELERQNQETAALQAILQQTWEEQDDWMDYYRQRFGPHDGYPMSTRSAGGSPARGQLLVDMRSQSLNTGPVGPLTDDDEMLLQEAFVPVLSPELAADGYVSDGPDGYSRTRQSRQHHTHRSSQRPFTLTKPVPFTFEERAANRPPTIMQVKLQQDLAIRDAEKKAAKEWRFKAAKIPQSNSPGKYEDLMLQAEVRRQIQKDSRLSELAGLVEKPFSFQARDEYRAAEKQMMAAAAKDPNRFQMLFYAKPIPKGVREEKFRYMMLELEAKRAGARQRLEEARQKAKERVMQDVSQRQDQADKAYKERLRVVDPVWNQKYETRPPGAVPDFNVMHAQWEQRLAKMRALNRRHLTIPCEFDTHNARNFEEKQARDRKAIERRQRVLLDMALDAELMPEQRWPHRMPRGRVRPTPPPVMMQPTHQVSDTRANKLRRAATQSARKAGQYSDPQDREQRALAKAKHDAQVRAAAYMKMKQDEQRRKPAEACDGSVVGSHIPAASTTAGLVAGEAGSVTTSQTTAGALQGTCKPSKPGAIERRKALQGSTNVPVQYIEARHAQAEKQARMEFEDVLLAKGVYNELRYQEG